MSEEQRTDVAGDSSPSSRLGMTQAPAATEAPAPPEPTLAATEAPAPPEPTLAATEAPAPPEPTLAATEAPAPPDPTLAAIEAPAPPEAVVIPSEARNPLPRVAVRLLQALWLGSGVFLMLAATAAFNAASNSTDAANVVGAMLVRWHYISLFVPVILMLLEWRRARPAMLIILFAGIMMASLGGLIDVRIRMMRNESAVPISSLSREDPVRRRFGMFHGASSLLLLGQVIAAAAAVATRE